MEKGYILLSRGLLDSDVFASQKLLKIWVWCLCKANFKDRSIPHLRGSGEQIIKVKRGQFIFGRHKAEEELFIDGSTIYKLIKKLEVMGMIKISSNKSFSLITVCKYDTYQDNNTYKVAREEQESPHRVPTESPQSNTTNTLPNVNTLKKDKQIEFEKFWDLYDKKVGDKKKCSKKFNSLSAETIQKIFDTLPDFMKSIKDKQFQPHPLTYLNNSRWNDELGGAVKKVVYNAQNF